MLSHELALMLLAVPNQPVMSWCPDAEDWVEVTGFTHSDYAVDGKVKLYNDTDENYDE